MEDEATITQTMELQCYRKDNSNDQWAGQILNKSKGCRILMYIVPTYLRLFTDHSNTNHMKIQG